jgi:hypothetical protein
MNKTVYLRDEEVPIWERARELSGDKLSPVILGALRAFIVRTEAELRGFERIEVAFKDGADHDLPKRKAFFGRWIIHPQKPFKEEIDEFSYSTAIAETAKGGVVVLEHREGPERDRSDFSVFPSFEKAAAVNGLNVAVCAALQIRGVPVEELDI